MVVAVSTSTCTTSAADVHSRVMLKCNSSDEDLLSSYINANYIRNYVKKSSVAAAVAASDDDDEASSGDDSSGDDSSGDDSSGNDSSGGASQSKSLRKRIDVKNAAYIATQVNIH